MFIRDRRCGIRCMHDADHRLHAWHQYAAHQPLAGVFRPVRTGIHHIRRPKHLYLYRQRRFRIRFCRGITAYGLDVYDRYVGRHCAARRRLLRREHSPLEKVYIRLCRVVSTGPNDKNRSPCVASVFCLPAALVYLQIRQRLPQRSLHAGLKIGLQRKVLFPLLLRCV